MSRLPHTGAPGVLVEAEGVGGLSGGQVVEVKGQSHDARELRRRLEPLLPAASAERYVT